MTEQEQIGARLNAFRNNLHMTQNAFAQSIGVSQGFLNGVIRGKKGIGDTILVNIAKEYKNLNLRWLITGEGEMFELQNLYIDLPGELSSGVEESLKIEYLKEEGELERIKRILREHEQRLCDLERRD